MNYDEQDAPDYGERQEFIRTKGFKGLLGQEYDSSVFIPNLPLVNQDHDCYASAEDGCDCNPKI